MNDGKKVKMSKRSGNFIMLSDLINDLGKDVIRFIMLTRKNEQVLEFDFKKALAQNKDSPVFYVQYAYARINSLLRTLNIALLQKVDLDENNFHFNKMEEKIVRKVFEWPKIIESTAKQFDLHKLPFYLYELSTLFHSYWSKGNEDEKYKFILNNQIQRKEILLVINLLAIVIQNGMKILGVSLPKKM